MNNIHSFQSAAELARVKWDDALGRLERAHAANLVAGAAYDKAKEAYDAARPKRGWADGVVILHGESLDAQINKRADREAMKASGYVVSLEAQTLSLRELIDAIEAFIDTPAPDLAGGIRKLEIAIEHNLDAGGLTSLLDDLRRHTGRN